MANDSFGGIRSYPDHVDLGICIGLNRIHLMYNHFHVAEGFLNRLAQVPADTVQFLQLLVEGVYQLFEVIPDDAEGLLLVSNFALTGDGDMDIEMGLGQFHSNLGNLLDRSDQEGSEYPGSCAGKNNRENHRANQSDIRLFMEAVYIRDFIIKF
ncbi:hypothetical protein Holit_02935 [Hollandina sp. SP2]